MPRRYSIVCDDSVAARIDAIAREYDLPEAEVVKQLVEIGLERRNEEFATPTEDSPIER